MNENILDKVIKKLIDNGYEGVAGDVRTSLLRCGLVVKEYPEELHCIYCVERDTDGVATLFDQGTISKFELDTCLVDPQFDKKIFLDHYLIEEADWIKLPYHVRLWDLLKFVGYQHLFGFYTNPFTLEGLLGLDL